MSKTMILNEWKCVPSGELFISSQTNSGVLLWVNNHQHLNGQGKM